MQKHVYLSRVLALRKRPKPTSQWTLNVPATFEVWASADTYLWARLQRFPWPDDLGFHHAVHVVKH